MDPFREPELALVAGAEPGDTGATRPGGKP